MTIREFKQSDQKAVEEIFALYWTDPEFLQELSDELLSFLKTGLTKDLGFFVSEENDEITGIVGFKKLADYFKPYTKTDNPIELYVIAVKNKWKGVGKKLKIKLIEEAEKMQFGEILFFSPNSHSESWNFHDSLGFERAGEITPPNDKPGQIWRKVL
ncbi:MAG: GNAT family N-acetyltransferase [Patescibacteria group bacterium]|nr:GNAT family N-acetyltransferase [Patescibacteria group bacterium]